MNKEEALWVIIRSVGLVFLILAFVAFTEIASSGSYFIYVAGVIESSSGAKVAENTVKALLTKSIGNFILYSIAAFYFMRKGLFVHNVLSK